LNFLAEDGGVRRSGAIGFPGRKAGKNGISGWYIHPETGFADG